MVWPETLSRTPWLINKLAGGPPFFGSCLGAVLYAVKEVIFIEWCRAAWMLCVYKPL